MALHQDRTSHLQGNARQRSAHSTAAEGLAMRIECRQKAEWAMQGRNPGSVVGAGHTVDTSCGVEPPHQRSEETLAAPASLIRDRKGRQADRDGEVGVAGVAESSAYLGAGSPHSGSPAAAMRSSSLLLKLAERIDRLSGAAGRPARVLSSARHQHERASSCAWAALPARRPRPQIDQLAHRLCPGGRSACPASTESRTRTTFLPIVDAR